MLDPVVLARADHPISRRNIDSDALRVLYRLHEHGHVAYLVGGSVRDLLLSRRPKDFDIGTSAHPYQIKKLFRNCWIIGRRFRLAHVKFGQKTIEVATFRRIITETEPAPAEAPVVASAGPDAPPASGDQSQTPEMIHRDNTYGTPEEDAFRRDFTVNGLFYDIATHAVIDYVGGLGDLERRLIRSIGDPRVRFVEDPVRMLRAAVMAARLSFDMDPLVIEAIAEHRELILKASPARLLEEYYKILRSGASEAVFRTLGRVRLLDLITPELADPPDQFWESLARLDRYRRRFAEAPPELGNTTLTGALLAPLGLLAASNTRIDRDPRGDRVTFGVLPIARKDLDRLRQVMQLLPRLTEANLPPRVARGLAHRPAFPTTLAWLDIFGDAPDAVAAWTEVRATERPRASAHAADEPPPGADAQPDAPVHRRRRRRRRRRRGPKPGPPPA